MAASNKNRPISTVSPALISALRKVLRPLIKLMLSKGITYSYLIDIIKELFVEVADKEFMLGSKPSSDSYLSLLTGVHRKDIKRLRPGIDSKPEIIPEAVSMGARFISIWTSDARYLDSNNHPKPLPLFKKEGGDISFEGLVSSVSRDIRSRVVLDEYQRLGVVHFDDKKRVCLNVEAFIPTKGFEEKAFYFGHNLHDHAAAATHNMLYEDRSFIERSVYYDALSPDSIQSLAEQAESLGMQSLLAINKEAIELEKKDKQENNSQNRMTFGIYFFSEQLESQPPVNKKDTPSNKTIIKKDNDK